jgi:hypothetical protein
MRSSPPDRSRTARRWFLVVVLAALAVLAACHRPSLRDRARSLGGGVVAVGGKLAAVMKPIAPSVDVKAMATGALKQAAHDRIDRAIDRGVDQAADAATPKPRPQPEPTASAGGDRGVPDGASPGPQPAASTPVTVQHTNVAKPTMFVLRWQTRGGKSSCEAYPSQDECNSRCTSMLRASAFSKPDDSTPKGCTCLEQDGGC